MDVLVLMIVFANQVIVIKEFAHQYVDKVIWMMDVLALLTKNVNLDIVLINLVLEYFNGGLY